MVYCYARPYCCIQNTYLFLKTFFLLPIQFSGILNCETISICCSISCFTGQNAKARTASVDFLCCHFANLNKVSNWTNKTIIKNWWKGLKINSTVIFMSPILLLLNIFMNVYQLSQAFNQNLYLNKCKSKW
jgi:hypothetical protein